MQYGLLWKNSTRINEVFKIKKCYVHLGKALSSPLKPRLKKIEHSFHLCIFMNFFFFTEIGQHFYFVAWFVMASTRHMDMLHYFRHKINLLENGPIYTRQNLKNIYMYKKKVSYVYNNIFSQIIITQKKIIIEPKAVCFWFWIIFCNLIL